MKHTPTDLRRRLAEAIREQRWLSRQYHTALKRAAEERRRRLDLEAELPAIYERRSDQIIRYVERKVYKPMPPREIVKRQIVERVVYIPQPRRPGWFGRFECWLDKVCVRGGAAVSSCGS